MAVHRRKQRGDRVGASSAQVEGAGSGSSALQFSQKPRILKRKLMQVGGFAWREAELSEDSWQRGTKRSRVSEDADTRMGTGTREAEDKEHLTRQ